MKIIGTVRDYAKAKVISKIKDYEEKTKTFFTMGLINIGDLKEEQLIEILKKEKNIKRNALTNKIMMLSQKNARLMMMVADIILSKKNIEINSTEDIYKLYFRDIIKTFYETNQNAMNVLGIISILNVVDITNEKHKEIVGLLNITVDEFRENMKILNEFEIIDMIDSDTAKISEQCLANYSIYLILIENKNINFEDLIITLFPNNRTRLVENINMLCSIWQNESIGDMLELAVKKIWKNIDEYNINKEAYLETFARILETEALAYCIEYIGNLKENKKELNFDDINNKNRKFDNNYVFKLISQFKYSDRLDDVLTIIGLYIEKDNTVIPDVYKLFVDSWQFQEEVLYNNFSAQISVVNKLKELSNNYKDANINKLMLLVIKEYMKTNGNYAEQNGKRGLKIIQYALAECEQLRKLRNTMLEILKDLCNVNELKVYTDDILYNLYSFSYNENENLKEIALGDKEIISYIINTIKCNGLTADLIVEEIYESYETFNIPYKKIEHFSKEYELYKLFTTNYNTIEDNREVNIKKFVSEIKENEVQEIIEIIRALEKEPLINQNYRLTSGITCFWKVLFVDSKLNKINILESCLENNIVENMPKEIIINLCIKEYGYNNTKNVITKYEYNSKFYWMLACYSLIPDELVNIENKKELIEFISRKVKINKGHSINLNFLDKYLPIDNNIYVEVLKIIYDVYKNDKFEFSIYTALLFNKYTENTPQKLLEVFKSNYDILMDSYILLYRYKEYVDFDGTYFSVLINIDPDKFIDKYVDTTGENISYFHHRGEACLNYIWKESDVIISNILKKVFEIKNDVKRSKIMKEIFVGRQEVLTIQEEYLENLIVEKIPDKDVMYLLFKIISERSEECRVRCINKYLENNDDFEDFKKINLESGFFSFSGSEVPIIEDRIQYYTKINDNIKKLGIKYIKHNEYIENKIYNLQQEKEKTLRREFIEDWL